MTGSTKIGSRVVVLVAGIVMVGVMIVLGYVAGQADFTVGIPLYDPAPVYDPASKTPFTSNPGLREAVDLYLRTYQDFTKLIVGVFAAVAFLVSYQLKKGMVPTNWSWAALAGGLVCLVGAMGAALLGTDTLLHMVGRNSIDLSLQGLTLTRWWMLIFLLLGVGSIGLFAVNVVLGGGQQSGGSKSE